MEFRDDEVCLEEPLNALDELVLDVVSILDGTTSGTSSSAAT
jgi:hypothetical protein